MDECLEMSAKRWTLLLSDRICCKQKITNLTWNEYKLGRIYDYNFYKYSFFFYFWKIWIKKKLCSNILLLLMLYKNGTMFHVKGGLWNANYPRNSVVFFIFQLLFLLFPLTLLPRQRFVEHCFICCSMGFTSKSSFLLRTFLNKF